MASDGCIRFRLLLHYDGSGYHGWQFQPGVPTVQGEVEAALQRLTGERRRVTGAGRTDQGVHATGQVAAVDVPRRWDAERLRRALNAVLPGDIWVERVEAAEPDFHPRFDALARSYLYRVGTEERASSPFHRPWCWVLRRPLDAGKLRDASSLLPGIHSFRSFARAGQEERGDRCRVQEAAWEPWEGLGFSFRITANRFLHHMVRYLVGTMVAIARGERPLEDMRDLLLGGRPGLRSSPPAPPEGLFLTGVAYPADGGADGSRGGTPTISQGLDSG